VVPAENWADIDAVYARTADGLFGSASERLHDSRVARQVRGQEVGAIANVIFACSLPPTRK
jgi:hypothetical protein